MVDRRKKIVIETTVCEANPVYFVLKYLEENQITLRDAICAGLMTHYGTLTSAYFHKSYQEVEKLSKNSVARLNVLNQTALSLSLYGQIEQSEALTTLEKQISPEKITYKPVVSLNLDSDKEKKSNFYEDNDTSNLDID